MTKKKTSEEYVCEYCGITTSSPRHKCREMLTQYSKEVCEYCNKEVIITDQIMSMQGHLRVCKTWRKIKSELLSNITREFLIEEHHIKGKSIACITEEIGLKNKREIVKLCNEFDVKIQKVTNPNQVKGRLKRTAKTCMEKYGCKHHLYSDEIRDKIKQTVNDKYGVDNVRKVPEIIEKIQSKLDTQRDETKEKVKQTCLERYGVDNVRKAPEIIEKMKTTKIENGTVTHISKSSQEFFWKVYNLLSEHIKPNVYFHELNKEFGKMGKDQYYCYDFVITGNINICIEYNGDYWHGNPKIYSAKDKLYSGLLAEDIWDRDKTKLNLIKSLGFNTYIIWESDITDQTPQDIVNYIESHLE